MPYFENDNALLHYTDDGEGMPVVLLHGFGMSARSCWGSRGWPELLNSNGYRAIALDSRGHGESSKFTDPEDYDAELMKQDVLKLLDHLGIDSCCFVGHSMGGRTVLNLLAENSDRVLSTVIVSNGNNVFSSPNTGPLREALLSNDLESLPPPRAKFVKMLLSFGNDPIALAAYCANPRPPLSEEYLAGIDRPVKIVCGANDAVTGDASQLQDAIEGSEVLLVPGCEHTDVLDSPLLHEATVNWFAPVKSG